MKKRPTVIIAALVIVYLIINMAAVITYPNEYKVIKTMGKISRVTTEPGFSLRIPLVQSETTISKSRQLYDIAPTEIYTSDKKKMEVDAYIIWKVTDPEGHTLYLFGTIHVGDARSDAVLEKVSPFLLSCDALAVEFDLVAYEKDLGAVMADYQQFVYTDGSTVRDRMPEELY